MDVMDSQDMWNCTTFATDDISSNISDLAANNSDQLQMLRSSLHHLFHQPIHLQFRLAALWILASLGSVGNLLVLVWLCGHRNWRSRINLLILHLTMADTLVILMAICPQLAWEYAQRQWVMGDGMCRLFKFLQTAVISVSNYMVVVLAIDRYCAIRRPLKKAFRVGCLTGSAWSLAVVLNIANIFLFETKEIDGEMYCRNKLYDRSEVYMQVYITSIAVLVFVVPLLLICFTYARIFQKISSRKKASMKSGKIQLQATSSSALPKAKVKTFKMTVVILSSFMICGTPYFVCDIWRVYGGQTIPPAVWGVLGALAVSNSCTNPFVFLAFNSTFAWWLTFARGGQQTVRSRTQTSSGITLQTNTDASNATAATDSGQRSNCQPEGAQTTLIEMEDVDTCTRNLINGAKLIKSSML